MAQSELSSIRLGDLLIDRPQRRVSVGDREVDLTDKEFALLEVLASDPIRVFSKQELLTKVWGYRTEARTRTLDAHTSRLRCKLDAKHARYVINCWGVGFRLVDSIDRGSS